MTQQEITGSRKGDLRFSQWIRDNLPDSSFGFMVTDIDFILYNWNTKKLMLLEIKMRDTNLKKWQENIFNNLSKWIKNGIDDDWTYLGFNIIKFQNTFFNDGDCHLNNRKITEGELRIFLSKI